MSSTKEDTLKVPGASLHYEVRGSGPLLLLIPGAPADSTVYGGIIEQLVDKYTVVTYDPRGYSRSSLDGEPEDQYVDIHAEDAYQLLKTLDLGPAHVLGCSGGAMIGLELVATHPEAVNTLIAHEPPAVELLPDVEHWRSFFSEVRDTYRTEGAGPAMGKFIIGVGGKIPDQSEWGPQGDPTPEMLEMMARMQSNMEFFLGYQVKPFIGYQPDVDKLKSAPARIVVLGGTESDGTPMLDASVVLAEGLGVNVVKVPGDHQGFATHPAEFAGTMHKVITETDQA